MTELVAYATAQGSTRGIADRIAARLGERHLAAQARPVSEIGSVFDYDVVVVGSAIQARAWLPEAVRFMRNNATTLAVRPVWLFSVGMPGALARPLRRSAMREGPKALAKLPDIVRPVGQRQFTGVVRRDQLPFVSRVVLRLMAGHTGDFRDWPQIEAWADDIAAHLAEIGARSGQLPGIRAMAGPAGPQDRLRISGEDAAGMIMAATARTDRDRRPGQCRPGRARSAG